MRARLFDAAVVACVLALLYLERGLAPPGVAAIGVVMALALLARRVRPVPVAAAVYTLAIAQLLVRPAVRMFDVCVVIAMYSVVKYQPRALWGILAGAGAAVGVLVAAVAEQHNNGNFWVVLDVIGAITVSAWVTAYSVRTRRLYVASLEERAATLERERDHLARLAAADERAAIARELHDVIAHSLSVMIVQADGAAYTLDPSATQARQALDTIATTGRDALDDMRRVLAVLRGSSVLADSAADSDRRRVGLAELGDLAERAGAAGLKVRIEPAGDLAALGAAEELTAYRVVQESVTNALRHAGAGASLTVRLELTGDRLTITATDDGTGGPVAPGAGHGLVGMRERVAMHGGTFAAGPGDGGGWRVRAEIPVTGGSTR
ncbi:sensor histidine kinase [Dactylosporangium sp. CA-233914]|uniref:sensor histidine kinase n=1 Tax=Dactylosporangium sp. CA-233914 TaxID=3239934 RepID=UPI003D931131